MNKILVTGASGLLGSSLVPHLKKCGFKVVTHAHVAKADVNFDLADITKTHGYLEQLKPDVIVNLVGQTNVELCENQVCLAHLANTRTVEALVGWRQKSNLNTHLVQISTDHVYDGMGLHNEDDVAITNNYAFSKYAGELAALRVPSTILRTNFIGRSNVENRESLSDWIFNSIVAGKKIQVLDDVYFSPLSMTTLVEMIALVVQKKPLGIFNLGSTNGISKADFAFSFAELLKFPTGNIDRIKICEANFFRAYRPSNMQMDSSKFENEFGVRLPKIFETIQQITKDYYEVAQSYS